MVENFKFILIHFLKEKYKFNIDESFIIDFNSSSEMKFSCHLIVDSKKFAFRDNVSMTM